ncbi:MAG TPA: hypothetical protein VM053_07200 [Gemmatimonadaceae bacterium]|nr:hypothetical protein [Gemmatimonadaceae bacterium]
MSNLTVNEIIMDLGIIAAVIMLIAWAVITFTTNAPGYVHLLLTIGFFLLFWRIAERGSKRAGQPRSK